MTATTDYTAHGMLTKHFLSEQIDIELYASMITKVNHEVISGF